MVKIGLDVGQVRLSQIPTSVHDSLTGSSLVRELGNSSVKTQPWLVSAGIEAGGSLAQAGLQCVQQCPWAYM